MAKNERIEGSISSWLEETAQPRLPERVLEATFARTRKSKQQVGWRALLARLRMPRFVPALAGAAVVVVAAALALNFFVSQQGLGGPNEPRTPFLGTWISTSDNDGGTQTMIVERADNNTVVIVVNDTIASVCNLTPSTMTGNGTIDGNKLVIPTPDYRCDDGSEPHLLSGEATPLNEFLRDLTYVRDPQRNVLVVAGAVWHRPGATPVTPAPTGDPTAAQPTTSAGATPQQTSGQTLEPAAPGSMWPQSSMDEVRQAQEHADAGDPAYSWQVDSALSGDSEPWGAKILDRFIREGLGWEEFRTGNGYASAESIYDELVFFRCAPGQTNPLYPDDPEAGQCAPTIDDFRYESVMVTIEQPWRRDLSGIWVVTAWQTLQPAEPSSLFGQLYPDFTQGQVEQVTPLSDGEATALLESFLGARVEGEGAEQYVLTEPEGSPFENEETPLLYAATSGAAYERYEIDRRQGPVWPSGWIEFRTRLFAEDGTVVEQSFAVIRQEDGRLGLVYGYPQTNDFPTTENGQPVPIPYSFLDGTVSFAAALPWNVGGGDPGSGQGPTLATYLGNPGVGERLEIVADPLPIETGCEPGPTPADAEALAQSIQSDPDLQATAPVAVSVGGIDALQMDVVAAPGMDVVPVEGMDICNGGFGGPLVLTYQQTGNPWPVGWLNNGGRMRLYLLDLPEGSAAEILAIGIAAPESEFEKVLEAATPIVDSIEFHTP